MKWNMRGQRGQALLEAALVLPVLLILAFGVVIVGRVVHGQVAVQAAAREAGRALATGASESAALSSAQEGAMRVAAGYGLADDRFGVQLDTSGFDRGGRIQARATYQVALTDIPLLSRADITVSATHAERIDLYRSREASAP